MLGGGGRGGRNAFAPSAVITAETKRKKKGEASTSLNLLESALLKRRARSRERRLWRNSRSFRGKKGERGGGGRIVRSPQGKRKGVTVTISVSSQAAEGKGKKRKMNASARREEKGKKEGTILLPPSSPVSA